MPGRTDSDGVCWQAHEPGVGFPVRAVPLSLDTGTPEAQQSQQQRPQPAASPESAGEASWASGQTDSELRCTDMWTVIL